MTELMSGLLFVLGIIVFIGIQVMMQRQGQKRFEAFYQKHAELLEREQLVQAAQADKILKQELFDFRLQLEKSMRDDFRLFSDHIDKKIMYLQHQVDNRLEKGFEQTAKTFENIIERLGKIDQAQKKIDALSTNIMSLQQILNDKKARGAFGEIQLTHIFKSVFGVNDQLYRTQYTLSNYMKVDLMLFAPQPMGNVAIDSKFPLENFQKLVDSEGLERRSHERQFKQDVKKHIDDIAKKYIISGETAEYALLFLPAEAIFSYIHAYCQDVIEYGYQQRVWLTSPTTLMAMLTTLQVVLQNIERDKYAVVIRKELQMLSQEFGRYQQRWHALAKHIDQVAKDVKDVNITSQKIISKFSQIESTKFDSERAEIMETEE